MNKGMAVLGGAGIGAALTYLLDRRAKQAAQADRR